MDNETIDMYAIVERVRAAGFYAYVEYTGGGVATIYASSDENPNRPGLPGMQHTYACGEADHYHDPGAQAVAGPGWFVGEHYSTRNPEGLPDGAYASLRDFYVGPDDQGDTEPYAATLADTVDTLARRIVDTIRRTSA